MPGMGGKRSVGVLVDKDIVQLIEEGCIFSDTKDNSFFEGQIQPASLDLRLGLIAYRVQAGMLPGTGRTVRERMAPLMMSQLDLTKPQLLEKGAVYLVPLQEHLALPVDVEGIVSPKSSTGRLDIFVRLVTDGGNAYDRVEPGYEGPLWVEIMPLTFPILVRAGDRLNQLRLKSGAVTLTDAELQKEHAVGPLGYVQDESKDTPLHISEGLWTSIDLEGSHGKGERRIIGYRARQHTQPVDLARVGQYDWREFWDAISYDDRNRLILYPGEFYIFVSREKLRVPPHLSAELVAVDTRVGELRVHYAGFFDPGFGHDPEGQVKGTPAVLEVRAHDVPMLLEHGQRIGRFTYDRLSHAPSQLYGAGIGSNYAGQGLRLAKQFKM